MNRGAERLGAPARDLIETAGLSLQALAEASGVSWTTLSRWRRKEHDPTPEAARKLAAGVRERALAMLDAAATLEAAARLEEDTS